MGENDELLKRQRQLRYRANHRGIKEMDIILGNYADKNIEIMNAEELNQFEALMEHNDIDLLQWFTGQLPISDEFSDDGLKCKNIDSVMFQKILNGLNSNLNIRFFAEKKPGITSSESSKS